MLRWLTRALIHGNRLPLGYDRGNANRKIRRKLHQNRDVRKLKRHVFSFPRSAVPTPPQSSVLANRNNVRPAVCRSIVSNVYGIARLHASSLPHYQAMDQDGLFLMLAMCNVCKASKVCFGESTVQLVQKSAVPPTALRTVNVWRRRGDNGALGYYKAAHFVLISGHRITLGCCFTRSLSKLARFKLRARYTNKQRHVSKFSLLWIRSTDCEGQSP